LAYGDFFEKQQSLVLNRQPTTKMATQKTLNLSYFPTFYHFVAMLPLLLLKMKKVILTIYDVL
jgi:hypothetical protein